MITSCAWASRAARPPTGAHASSPGPARAGLDRPRPLARAGRRGPARWRALHPGGNHRARGGPAASEGGGPARRAAARRTGAPAPDRDGRALVRPHRHRRPGRARGLGQRGGPAGGGAQGHQRGARHARDRPRRAGGPRLCRGGDPAHADARRALRRRRPVPQLRRRRDGAGALRPLRHRRREAGGGGRGSRQRPAARSRGKAPRAQRIAGGPRGRAHGRAGGPGAGLRAAWRATSTTRSRPSWARSTGCSARARAADASGGRSTGPCKGPSGPRPRCGAPWPLRVASRPGPVDVGHPMGGVAALVASTSGPGVELRVSLAPDLPPALAGANRLGAAVLSLAVRATPCRTAAPALTRPPWRGRALPYQGRGPRHGARATVGAWAGRFRPSAVAPADAVPRRASSSATRRLALHGPARCDQVGTATSRPLLHRLARALRGCQASLGRRGRAGNLSRRPAVLRAERRRRGRRPAAWPWHDAARPVTWRGAS